MSWSNPVQRSEALNHIQENTLRTNTRADNMATAKATEQSR